MPEIKERTNCVVCGATIEWTGEAWRHTGTQYPHAPEPPGTLTIELRADASGLPGTVLETIIEPSAKATPKRVVSKKGK